MMVIHKYPFEPMASFWLDMPARAEILDVQVQNDIPCLWALVNPSNGLERRQFKVFGTGQKHKDLGFGYHIGTFQMHDGRLVHHLFDYGPSGPVGAP